MAEIFKTVKGKKLTKFLAMHPTVQKRMDNIMFEAKTKAETTLIETRLNDDPLVVHGASIHLSKEKMDHFITLEDRATAHADLNPLVRNLNTALAIEVGRAGGEKEITVRDPENPGKFIQKTIKWGSTPGSHILGSAFDTKFGKG